MGTASAKSGAWMIAPGDANRLGARVERHLHVEGRVTNDDSAV
jgi:hypothetical protein